jgi:hypothetical protein
LSLEGGETPKTPGALIDLLRGGDRRSIGRAAEALVVLEGHPDWLGSLIGAMSSSDPVLRMRAADVAEKYTRPHPGALQPFRAEVLDLAGLMTQPEVRWHLVQMLPRLDLSPEEVDFAFSILCRYLADPSRIVRTFAMQGLADLALRDTCLIGRVLPVIEANTAQGTPAMQSRGRKLLARLARAGKTG